VLYRRRVRLLVTIGAIVGLLASGCGSEQDAAPTAPADATTATAADEAVSGPFGEFEREVTEAEITTTPGQEAPPPGTWHLTLGPTVIQVVDAGGFRYAQELTVTGETLEIERYIGGDGIFCEDDKPSTYSWRLDGDRLTLSPTKDECPDRMLILDAEWRKVG
jgi:hypothetical protein